MIFTNITKFIMNGQYPAIFLNGRNQHKNIVKRHGVKVLATKDGLTVEFESIEKAAEFCGTYTCTIQRCFNGKQKQGNGWMFKRG